VSDSKYAEFSIFCQTSRARNATSGASVETGVKVHTTADVDERWLVVVAVALMFKHQNL